MGGTVTNLRRDFSSLLGSDLRMAILFVTSRCNARCRHCFYWEELNKEGDLTFDELRRLSGSMPRFSDLWVGGGEPFLRDDLPDVIELFHRNNGISFAKVPTNGLTPRRIADSVERTLNQAPEVDLDVNVSIDGFAETHDRIRAVPGNFEKATETIRALEELKESYDSLCVYVNSVITSENLDELLELGRHFFDEYELDGHYFNIIRGDPMDDTLNRVDEERLRRFYRRVLELNRAYVEREAERRGFRPKALWKKFRKGGYAFVYQTQFESHVYGERWPMPCKAGETSLTIDFDGDVRICELREKVGNLRDYDMDFQRLFQSEEWREEVEQKYQDRCWDNCTHVCFMYDSIVDDPKTILNDVPKADFSPSANRDGKGESDAGPRSRVLSST